MRLPIRPLFRRRCLPTVTVFALLVALTGLGATAYPALARDDTPGGPTPPRLGFVEGDVSFWRPGAEDWSSAQVNTALAAGDSLYAGDGGNFELQSGPRAFVRGGANTELGIESLEPSYMQLKVTGGRIVLDLKQLARGQTFEVDTPAAAFTVDRPGYYRIDVDESTSAFIARRGGTAMVVPEHGETVDIGENQRVVFGSADVERASVGAAPDLDAWDRWNYERVAQLGEAPRSAQYVPHDVAGVDDLDRYGDWRDVPKHGNVWVPRDTTPDWAPYSTGRWIYDPHYEWTWVDDAPWGWAPYHYGRWVNTGAFWGWAPGPIVARPVYAPALVAFFGAPGIGVSVTSGLPFVSWVALGYGEPVIPWWGGSRFAGRPYWGGWGGPRYVNNVVVRNTTIINVRSINRFQNMHVRNAMVGIDRGQFGRGHGQHVRLDARQRFRPVHGQLGVKPVAASLRPNERPGRRPPDGLRARQVIATRPPQDSRGRLRAHGLEPTTSGAAAAPQPRIVRPRRGPEGQPGVASDGHRPAEAAPAAAPPPRAAHQRPRGGTEARTRDRSTTPPPHGERPQHGRSSSQPESAAPPSPPKAQRQGGRHVGASRPPARPAPRQERAKRQREPPPPVAERPARHVPQAEPSAAAPPRPTGGGTRKPIVRNDVRRPERAHAARPSREAAPRGGGPPAAQRSSPAVARHEDREAREPSAARKQTNQRPQHEKKHGQETP